MEASSSKEFDIAILLPTRGRTTMLERSIRSLVENATEPSRVQFIFGFDDDDQDSQEYFEKNIVPVIEEHGSAWESYEFKRQGYERLNFYVNTLAGYADADWFVFWNDDAVMLDPGWDRSICAYTGQFKILAFDTHNKHPYSIFPIVPHQWYDVLGLLSRHQLNDAYISQMAYLLDIMVRTDIRVEHDRFDLTGQNQDETFQQRRMFEGNPEDPRDFNHRSMVMARSDDTEKLSVWMREQGIDTSWWENVKAGKQQPWEKMTANDVNKFLSSSQ